MIKYFIENDKGEWLSVPGENVGSCWTRDPYKAWRFNPNPPYSGIRAHLTSPSLEAWNILQSLQEEECLDQARITQHEFAGAGYILRSDGVYGTIKWVYHPMFDIL